MSSLLRHTAEQRTPGRHRRVHELGAADRAELSALVDRDPFVNAVVAARLHLLTGVEPSRFGGTVIGARDDDGTLVGAAFCGGNLLPIGGGPAEWSALARVLVQRPRVCSSIVGSADAVTAIWSELAPVWGPARAIRPVQPLLVLDEARSLSPVDERVRTMHPDDLDAYLPAASAMFTEELGVSPDESTGTADYRRRVAKLIADGRAFGILDEARRVLFKADVGAISARTCQVQGVWVRPELRGRGLGTAALANVLTRALTLAPTVSLYVNDYNVAARRMYRRLGMQQVATLSTVMF